MRRLIASIAAALALAAAPASAFAPNVEPSSLGATVPADPIVYGDGREGTLEDFEGEVLIVTLWQVNCPYCHREMPVLDRLAGEMADEGVKVVGLGLDQDMGRIKGFLDGKGLTHIKPLMDVGKVNGSILSIEHFGRLSIATPTSFIVGKDGVVRATVWGLIDWDGEAARGYLRELAAEG